MDRNFIHFAKGTSSFTHRVITQYIIFIIYVYKFYTYKDRRKWFKSKIYNFQNKLLKVIFYLLILIKLVLKFFKNVKT